MAQLDDNVKLQVTFGDGQGSFDGVTTFDYSALQLLANIDDNNQLEVYWEINSVFTAAPGDPAREELELTSVSAAVREAIRKIPNTYWTADTATHTLTIQDISDQQNNTEYGSYWFPPSATVTSVQPVQVRRSTEVDSRIVSFEPGTRLTSENLNLANTQMFNAIQEITRYGLSGSGSFSGGIDLDDSSITDLGDVNINPLLPLSGYLEWDGINKQVTIQNVATGNFVPITNDVTSEIGQVLYLNDDTVNAGYIWKRLAASDILRKSGGVDLGDYFTNDVDAPIAALQSSFTFLNAEFDRLGFASDEFTFTDGTTDFAINMAGDITTTGTVDAGEDLTIAGVSVDDRISALETATPYWFMVECTTSDTITSSTGEVSLGLTDDWTSTTEQSGTATSDMDSSTGEWTAPRDMLIRVEARGQLEPQESPKPVTNDNIASFFMTYGLKLNIRHGTPGETTTGRPSYAVSGGALGLLVDSNEAAAPSGARLYDHVWYGCKTPEVHAISVLQVSAGDTIRFRFKRQNYSETHWLEGDVGVSNATATITEIR